MKVTASLTRVKAGYENHRLRTPEITGLSTRPEIGNDVHVTNENPLTPEASYRIVSTTSVVEFLEESDTMVRFKTETGSEYLWEIVLCEQQQEK